MFHKKSFRNSKRNREESETHSQQGDRIGLLSVFQNEGSKPKAFMRFKARKMSHCDTSAKNLKVHNT
jgi:hypothetical protein